ncbi:MAG: VIT domain-containing protein, partial [Myxococcota bacterium]
MLACLGTRVAYADDLDTAREQALSEVSHDVHLTIDDGVARYKVRRKFANRGTVAEEARLQIQLPAGAAVTGLRIRAAGRWHDGELMDAEEAAEVYAELTGVGPSRAKDPALLEWQWADEARLRVFPVLPGKVNTVEYTLTAPLEYREGRYVVSYPRFSGDDASRRPLVEPVLRVEPGHAGRLFVAGEKVRKNQRVVLGEAEPAPWIGEGGPDWGDGYVSSALNIDRGFTASSALVHVDIDHTYSGDLRLALVLPDGRHERLDAGDGKTNDIHETFEVPLDDVPSAGTWHLMVSDQAEMDVGTLDAWSLELRGHDPQVKALGRARGLPKFIPDASGEEGGDGQAVVEIEPPEIDTMVGRLGRVVASDAAGFSRVEIDVAPELRPLPRGASVVFVLDASHSADHRLPDAVRLIEGYLAHVPDARVEVVRFDRKAARVFGKLVGAKRAPAELRRAVDAGKLAPANGSALDAGLALAAS